MARVNIVKQIKVEGSWVLRSIPKKPPRKPRLGRTSRWHVLHRMARQRAAHALARRDHRFQVPRSRTKKRRAARRRRGSITPSAAQGIDAGDSTLLIGAPRQWPAGSGFAPGTISLTFALRAGFRPGRIVFGLPATRVSEKGLKRG